MLNTNGFDLDQKLLNLLAGRVNTEETCFITAYRPGFYYDKVDPRFITVQVHYPDDSDPDNAETFEYVYKYRGGTYQFCSMDEVDAPECAPINSSLHIVSCTKDLADTFEKDFVIPGDVEDVSIMKFPEVKENGRPYHESEAVKIGIALVNNQTCMSDDLYVFTLSSSILNGVRIGCKRHKFDKAVAHQLIKCDDKVIDHASLIDTDGRLRYWEHGVFDAWDDAITELF